MGKLSSVGSHKSLAISNKSPKSAVVDCWIRSPMEDDLVVEVVLLRGAPVVDKAAVTCTTKRSVLQMRVHNRLPVWLDVIP